MRSPPPCSARRPSSAPRDCREARRRSRTPARSETSDCSEYRREANMRTQETRPRKQEHHRHDDCCEHSECASGLRNNYFKGKRLTPESFRVEQRYQLERRRLLNRTLHGWGVAQGFGVEAVVEPGSKEGVASGRLTIGAGLALDACGRELLLLEPRTI